MGESRIGIIKDTELVVVDKLVTWYSVSIFGDDHVAVVTRNGVPGMIRSEELKTEGVTGKSLLPKEVNVIVCNGWYKVIHLGWVSVTALQLGEPFAAITYRETGNVKTVVYGDDIVAVALVEKACLEKNPAYARYLDMIKAYGAEYTSGDDQIECVVKDCDGAWTLITSGGMVRQIYMTDQFPEYRDVVNALQRALEIDTMKGISI